MKYLDEDGNVLEFEQVKAQFESYESASHILEHLGDQFENLLNTLRTVQMFESTRESLNMKVSVLDDKEVLDGFIERLHESLVLGAILADRLPGMLERDE